jgi:hypothetical protein
MLWLSDYPLIEEWRLEMKEIKDHYEKTGKVRNDIFRRKCRTTLGYKENQHKKKKKK